MTSVSHVFDHASISDRFDLSERIVLCHTDCMELLRQVPGANAPPNRRRGLLARVGESPQIPQITQIEMAIPPTEQPVHDEHEGLPAVVWRRLDGGGSFGV